MSSATIAAGVMFSGECLDERKIIWKIDNFDAIRRSVELIEAQRLTISLGNDVGFPTEWKCLLQPSIDNEEEEKTIYKNIGMYLGLISAPDGIKDAILWCQAKFIKTNQMIGPFVKNFIVDGEPSNNCWGWPNFVASNLTSANILNEGSLTMELQFKVFSTKHQFKLLDSTTEKDYKLKFASKLRADMAKLLVEPARNSEVETKIISEDAVEFSIIRAIISARSPVFETMFQADMDEARTGIVRLTDLNSETVRVLLHFFYTGELIDEWKSVTVLPELIYAAGKYQLPDLLAFLDDFARKACCRENAGKIVGHARRLGLKNAEKDLVNFMIKNMKTLDDIISFAEDSTVANFQ